MSWPEDPAAPQALMALSSLGISLFAKAPTGQDCNQMEHSPHPAGTTEIYPRAEGRQGRGEGKSLYTVDFTNNYLIFSTLSSQLPTLLALLQSVSPETYMVSTQHNCLWEQDLFLDQEPKR